MLKLAMAIALVWAHASPAAAQLQLSTVRGSVTSEAGDALVGATLELTDPLGAGVATTTTDGNGEFSFERVAPGHYAVSSAIDGFVAVKQSLQVTSALPIDLRLRMALSTAVTVTVTSDPHAGVASPATTASIAGHSVAAVPVRARSRGLQEAVATLPGWATEDNGLLHARGTDDGFLYVIDGVPVYERLDQASSLGPDLASVESIHVRTGYIPVEFGYKAGGVIDVRSKANAARWNGVLLAERSSERGTSGSAFAGGPIASRVSIAAGAAAQRTDRYLDPIDPDNLHNSGSNAGFTVQPTWSRNGDDVLSASLAAGRASFEVPNFKEQEEAGQDQRQRLSNANASISWQRAWHADLLSQAAGYVRQSSSRLEGSELDTPLLVDAARTLRRAGLIAGVTRRIGSHTLKAGFEAQRLMLDERFGFVPTDAAAPVDAFAFAARETPSLWAVFAQTDWQATDALMVSAGVRYDKSRMLLDRRQLSPRAGIAYRIGGDTVLRGSASRFFQPPQPENLLLASSEQARVLSPFADEDEEGGAAVEPERQWGYELGISRRLSTFARLDVAAWHRDVTNAADPNVFAGTTIIFPNAVASGRARGVDARLEVSTAAWSTYVNAAFGSVTQRGPIVGGLFLEDEVEELAGGDEFTPDHDQRAVISGGLTWRPQRSRASVAATVRYESGTPIQREEDELDELEERPGAGLVDFENGRVKARTVVSLTADVPIAARGSRSIGIRAAALNLFDARYAYNFGNPFSGTHFGAPRTVSIGLRVQF